MGGGPYNCFKLSDTLSESLRHLSDVISEIFLSLIEEGRFKSKL